MSQLAEKGKEKFHDYKSKYRQLKDELVEVQNDNAEMAEKMKEYELLVDEMTHDYEETIDNMTPQLFQKEWVKSKG
eukprot:4875767-Ditylum_brightwellii.AAC.1